MKTFIAFLLLITLSLTTYSQTAEEKAIIIDQYDIQALNSLKSRLATQEIKNKREVEEYIKTHRIKKRIVLPNGSVKVLAKILDGKPLYMSIDNTEAGENTKTDFLHSGGGLGLDLEGQNMTMGIWDEGILLTTHQEFQNADNTASRVTNVGGTQFDDTGFHANHVGGTMIAKGVNGSAKGMAPQASLRGYDFGDGLDETQILTEITDNALLLSNHSYGYSAFDNDGVQTSSSWLMGCYDTESRNWDEILYNAEYYLHVKSGGNAGGGTYTEGVEDGFDKLTGNANSKNNLVVANGNPTTFASGSVFMFINSSSSQGPSDDGRIKPDITADGTSLFSVDDGSDTAYATLSGTSMAAPNTTGTLLLLQQYYNQLNSQYMKAATLKALVCHTANLVNEDGPGPIYGWGLLDAKIAAETIEQDFSKTDALIIENTLADGETYTYTFTTTDTSPLSGTICWTDPAGVDQSGLLNSSTPALVNDLDLRITDANSNTFMPWMLQLSDLGADAITGDNLVDTVENVDIDSPTSATTYTLTVAHKGTLTNGSQNFSLIITGTNTTLNVDEYSVNDLIIWPNPTSEELFFKLKNDNKDDFTINIFDIQGRKVYTNSYDENNTVINKSIDVSRLTSGIYFLNLKQGNKIINKKIIIN
jgi:serine protease AprX